MVVGALVLYADAIDTGLKLAGVLISSASLGSIIGVIAAVLEGKPVRTIELWAFWGTASGGVFGLFLTACAAAALA
jgi:hypothetical protein